jgi:uncharacterized protein (DUF1786 family)
MKILAVDVGTGTQDIFLYNSQMELENGYKLVLPSPTMMIHRRIKEATKAGESIFLTGVIMGGGPSHWAAEAHVRAGLPVFATPDAARTFNDDLELVQSMGIKVVSPDEGAKLSESVSKIEFRDFDFPAIASVFNKFGVILNDLEVVAVAVFDHGNAPPNYSDRQFRFDYLNERINMVNSLSAFAFRDDDVPSILTRLQGVVQTGREAHAPMVVMDTAPAAVFGAMYDPVVASMERVLIANIGNFHTLAFRLGPSGIEGIFEHHTGLLDRGKLDNLIISLADGSLTHEEVFKDHGHGALIYHPEPFVFSSDDFDVIATGPRRKMMTSSSLRTYFAAPFGDMMLTGCFGLLAAVADLYPEFSEIIKRSLEGKSDGRTTPWDSE